MKKHKNPFTVRRIRQSPRFISKLAHLKRARNIFVGLFFLLMAGGLAMSIQGASAILVKTPSDPPRISGPPTPPAHFNIDAPNLPSSEFVPPSSLRVSPTFSGGNFRGYLYNQANDDTTAEQNPLELYDYINAWGRLAALNGIWNPGTGVAAAPREKPGGPGRDSTPPSAVTPPALAPAPALVAPRLTRLTTFTATNCDPTPSGTITPLSSDQSIGCVRLNVSNGPLLLRSMTFTYTGDTALKPLLRNLRLQRGTETPLATVNSIPADDKISFTCSTPCSLGNGDNDLHVKADFGNACGNLGKKVILQINSGDIASNAGTQPPSILTLSQYNTADITPAICTPRSISIDGRQVPAASITAGNDRTLACFLFRNHGSNYSANLTNLVLRGLFNGNGMNITNMRLREAPAGACSPAGNTNLNTGSSPENISTDGNISFPMNWTLQEGAGGNYDRHLVLIGNVECSRQTGVTFSVENASSATFYQPVNISSMAGGFPEQSTQVTCSVGGGGGGSTPGVPPPGGGPGTTQPWRRSYIPPPSKTLQANLLGDILIPPVFAQSIGSYGRPPARLMRPFPAQPEAASFSTPVRIHDDLVIQGSSDLENGRLDTHGVIVNTQPIEDLPPHITQPVTIADHLWVQGNAEISGGRLDVTRASEDVEITLASGENPGWRIGTGFSDATEGATSLYFYRGNEDKMALTDAGALVVPGSILTGTIESGDITGTSIGRFYSPVPAYSRAATGGAIEVTAACAAGDQIIDCNAVFVSGTSGTGSIVNDTNVRLTGTEFTSTTGCTVRGFVVAGTTHRRLRATPLCFSPDG